MVYALKNKNSLARLIEKNHLIEKNQQTDIVQPTTSSTPDSTADLSPGILFHDIYPVLRQGKSIGAVWLLSRLANDLGMTDALGDSRASRLELWQVLTRTLDQGSRLSATRLAKTHEIDFLE
jgi:hypothetical protein